MTSSILSLRMLKNASAMVVLALCAVTGIAAAKDDLAPISIMTMRVDGELAIDAQGKLLVYRIDTKLDPAIRAHLDKAIPTWSFSPVEIEGKPSAVKSKMRITLAAQHVATRYVVSVDNVVFHDDRESESLRELGITAKSLPPPAYPDGLMFNGVEGAVLLYIHVTPDGKAKEVIAAQSALFNVKGRDKTLTDALTQLEKNTVRAAKTWRFNVPAASRAADDEFMTVAIPVRYSMSKKGDDTLGQWRVEVRSERQSAPWLLQSKLAQDVGISDLISGEVMPLGSRMRLRENAPAL